MNSKISIWRLFKDITYIFLSTLSAGFGLKGFFIAKRIYRWWSNGYFASNKCILAIVGLAITLILIDYPIITSDKLLVAVFSGFFPGAGIGLFVLYNLKKLTYEK